MRHRLCLLALTGITLLLAAPGANAQVVNGALAATDPVFNRTLAGNPPSNLSGVGTSVFFDSYTFTVSVTGLYTIALTSTFDNFLSLYSPSFNSAAPLTNVVESSDDVNGTNAQIVRNLTGGTTFIAVATSFSNGATGAYTLTFTGPSAVTIGGAAAAAPEPGTLAFMGFAFLSAAAVRARRHKR
jgi:hypothetical protein